MWHVGRQESKAAEAQTESSEEASLIEGRATVEQSGGDGQEVWLPEELWDWGQRKETQGWA
jgi:hypothetical protein